MNCKSLVAVVIPCLNEAGFIGQLLDAVAAQDYPVHEIIVVDCGSVDGTLEILKRYPLEHPSFPLRLVIRPKGTIPEVLNAGIRAATGEIIVRLDAHSCPAESYIRLSVEALQQSGAGIVGGMWDIVPGASGATAQAIAGAGSHRLGAGDALYRVGPAAPARISVDTVPFGCYRKATWEKLGGYNENLLTNEDYEFNHRARMAGLQVVLDPQIRCTYIARSTVRDLAAQYFRYGWWKARMLKQYPHSLRWRQAVPAGLVAALVTLTFLGLIWRTALVALAALAVLYGVVLTAAALQLKGKAQSWRVTSILPLAFATIHFSWGTGALVNVLTIGKWPKWGADGRK
ncbi:MAG TPA: glycosyltransferase family 2 protein [Acidobacteriota bacterium]|nr:glycosyltransferase family 2 protein [Acidobacteriota bacterium]